MKKNYLSNLLDCFIYYTGRLVSWWIYMILKIFYCHCKLSFLVKSKLFAPKKPKQQKQKTKTQKGKQKTPEADLLYCLCLCQEKFFILPVSWHNKINIRKKAES